jgi:hypothetical protein
MWCVATITQKYLDKMNDVLALYEKPYSWEEPVVCFDEKSLQLLGEKHEPRPMREGMPLRRDYEYIRNGTVNIFCAVEPLAGRHLTGIRSHRTAKDFAGFIAWLTEQYTNAKTIHLVMDNLNTHFEASLIKKFGPRRGREIWSRFTPHYTPVHGSWLNQAEIEIGLIERQCLKNRRFENQDKLREQVEAWNRRANEAKMKIRWTFTAQKALVAFAGKQVN